MTPHRLRPAMITVVRLMAIAAALLMLTALVVNRSRAAFSATTSNTGNSFTTGTVVLTDDDSDTAMFSAVDMTPGSPVVRCIALTYSGTNTPATIRSYGTSTGSLPTYLDTTIEVGTGGAFGSCSGFTPASTIYNGTLANFSATHTNWSTGLATYTAAVNPTTRTLRFTLDVQDNPAAQGQSATAAFTFEAQD